MNFALVLFILFLISGFIALLDKLWWSKNRDPNEKPNKMIEYAHSFYPVFIFVLLLRSFLIEPFRIPSGSLEPSLQVGDFVAVNKFAYGIRLPILEKKILNIKTPKVGDVAVFRWPPNPTYDYIKRVVGVPGDHVSYHNKTLTINGREMQRTLLNFTVDESSGASVAKYHENLNGVIHAIYIRPTVPAEDFELVVPPGYYFMMGDNRDDSADSRFWGLVSDDMLRGKAILVWMSWNSQTGWFRWSNIGRAIKG